jgi:murein DD-endopeptidase MepM/ murein hydrolase activator NlpD
MKRNQQRMHRALGSVARGTLVLVVVAAAAVFSNSAIASCPDGWLDFEKSSGNGKVVLTARNHSDIPLTFTMDFDLRRLSASRDTTFTESLQPGESRRVVTLTRRSETTPGHYEYTTSCTIGNKDADHDDEFLYLLPYSGGTRHRVLQGYGSHFSHTGRETYTVDFYMKEGTPVHAARDGIVARIEESNSIGCWEKGCGAYANFIVVLHDDDTTGEYYHLQQDGVLVEPGQKVTAGQLIGLSGNTGHSTMPHLHFGVYRAIENGREQSIPVRYISENGIISKPRSGGRYRATGTQQRLTKTNAPKSDDDSRQLH